MSIRKLVAKWRWRPDKQPEKDKHRPERSGALNKLLKLQKKKRELEKLRRRNQGR